MNINIFDIGDNNLYEHLKPSKQIEINNHIEHIVNKIENEQKQIQPSTIEDASKLNQVLGHNFLQSIPTIEIIKLMQKP